MSHHHGRRHAVLPMLFGAILVLSACTAIDGGDGATGAPEPGGTDAGGDGGSSGGQLTIATGGTGGVYYPLGGGIANVISENIDGYTATIQETNASVDNMLLIQDGGADLALVLGDTASDAVNGTAPTSRATGRRVRPGTSTTTSSSS